MSCTTEATRIDVRPSLRAAVSRWLGRLIQMRASRHQRLRLLDLSDHHLRDIGLTRGEAEEEAARPLWDVPATWRR